MKLREVPPLHEIAKLEYKFKLLYFLVDLGIESALIPARIIWDKYVYIQSELTDVHDLFDT